MSKLKILFKICTRSYNRFYLHPVYTMRWIFCSDTSRVIIEKRNERWISASLSRQDSQFLSVSWCRDRILLFIFEPLVHGACAKWKRARLPRIGDTRIDFSLSLFLSFSALNTSHSPREILFVKVSSFPLFLILRGLVTERRIFNSWNF